MAKKTLNEAVVRRFQMLANLTPMNEMYMKEEEEEADAMMGAEGDIPADDAEIGPEEAPMGGDLELTTEEAQAIIDLGVKLESAMAGMGDDADAEMDADPELDAEEELMEALRGITYKPSKSEIVNEVAKRVAKRLKTARLHEAKLNRALCRK
jgi:hypothetical protein